MTILADVLDRIGLSKNVDLASALKTIRASYETVEDFERDFPSVCFALATGVGKTRLMGAFVAYLYLTGRSRNFFVLAPNTTIYHKLVADFTRTNSAKYVFKGIAQFTENPAAVVTGDTWDQGLGVRGSILSGSGVVINIFNVDKINKDGGRVRQLQEYIGESYFDYLAGLPDLVLMMDEAHRYRARAGMNAVAALRPVLGIELTATPKTVGSRPRRFKNVIFEYGLGSAMAEGFVKEAAVATRANFRKADYTREQLERIMLEDGVHYHEHVKAELEIYGRDAGRDPVHPFILIVAQDTTHAEEIREQVESGDFFEGRYRGRVLVIHSNQKGQESDAAMERLVRLERDNETDIVIHVNKLKEGWDVTNLYTIVPLRASASEILTEQTLGRGLRLPYGARTGVEAVDTLTVVAHDRFEEVIEKAKSEGSIVQLKQIKIGSSGGARNRALVLEVPTRVESMLAGDKNGSLAEMAGERPTWDGENERTVAAVTLEVIRDKYERTLTRGIRQLEQIDVQEEIERDVGERLRRSEEASGDQRDRSDVRRVVRRTMRDIANNTIEIPEIVVVPTSEVTFGFRDFDLEDLDWKRFEPVADEILIRNLRTENQQELARAAGGGGEPRVEDHVVRHLKAFDSLDYGAHADLIYKLASQAVAHLKSYLADDGDVENVVLNHGRELADFIYEQMMRHQWETPTSYQAKVSRGFRVLRPQNFNVVGAESIRDLNEEVVPRSETKRYIFGGLRKCSYAYQKFDSDDERRFAVLIDRTFEASVRRWIKPGARQFQIEYESGKGYEPDFVVETEDGKLIVEIKARKELEDETVVAKAQAAGEWVKYANEHAAAVGSAGWSYVLIPGEEIRENATLEGLVAKYRL